MAYQEISDIRYFNMYKKALEDFPYYLNDLYNHSQGKKLPEGWVKTSTFWLIHDEEVVGVVRIRHQEIECAGHIGFDISPNCRNKGYGNYILKLALEKVKDIGLEEIIITCSKNNIASKRIIENNSGKLLGSIYDEEDHEYLYKYCIKIRP